MKKSGWGFININIPLEMKFTVVAHSAGDGGGGWLVERPIYTRIGPANGQVINKSPVSPTISW